MDEVLVATPLPFSCTSMPHNFAGGISIRAGAPILWSLSCLKGFISEVDREKLDKTRYWLCASRPPKSRLEDVDDLYEAARQAMYALQIFHPSGAQNIYLAFHPKPDGWDLIGSQRPANMCSTIISRLTSAERRGLSSSTFDPIYAGVSRAFERKIVRLQNPILLLEQGTQTGNPVLAMLMFVMGLDMLFMAGDKISFVKRVAGFLGLNSFVFPQISSFDWQPALNVGEIIGDLYDFRNIIAHGREIPKVPFREEHEMRRTTGELMIYERRGYAETLTEAGLFVLTEVLRRILSEELFDHVAESAKWKAKMTLYEHRFKTSGGIVSATQHKSR